MSPTLFGIFINDIPIRYKKNKEYSLLFADDLSTYFIYNKTNIQLQNKIQKYLNLIENWLKNWRLMMSANKCSYLVFSHNKVSESNNIILKLFGSNINIDESQTFLGIRFDRNLTFKNHINYLKESCIKRLNKLKIVSNKSWGLSINTLKQLYISLVRSMLEYSSIFYTSLCKSNFDVLEKIQTHCLKTIYRKSKYESNSYIYFLSNFEKLNVRFDTLNTNYLRKCFQHKNDIIIDLFDDYIQYSSSRTLLYETPICKYKDIININ